MKILVSALLLIGLGWYGYSQYQRHAEVAPLVAPTYAAPQREAQFKCDGRTHCSQMTSCAEATYFLRHCPGTKMDGNNDGVPCEKQHCR